MFLKWEWPAMVSLSVAEEFRGGLPRTRGHVEGRVQET
jgi:hypothetical protein